MDASCVIEIEKLFFAFSKESSEWTLKDINFSLGKGEKVGIIGQNGAGKTTFFHLMMGLYPASSGTIRIFGKTRETPEEFQSIYGRISLMFQDADDQLFCPTVLEDVAFGPLNLGKTKEEALEISRNTLVQLGLEDFENRVTHKLSGGEKRLVCLASVLSMQPEILLLDEPAAGLDPETKNRMMKALDQPDMACIIISHDTDILSGFVSGVYEMNSARLTLKKN